MAWRAFIVAPNRKYSHHPDSRRLRRALSSGAPATAGDCIRDRLPWSTVCSNRESLSLISSVTNQGKVRWMVFGGALNAKILIRFFKRLIQSAHRKVFLILDNLRVHHAKVVREWLAKQEEHLEVFYLPSYSPELNPDECLNADLKQAVTTKAPSRSKGQLKKVTVAHLRKLSKSPERIKSYFRHQPVRYAA